MKRLKIIIATALFTLLCICSCRPTDDVELPTINKTKKELLKERSDSIFLIQNLDKPAEPKTPPGK